MLDLRFKFTPPFMPKLEVALGLMHFHKLSAQSNSILDDINATARLLFGLSGVSKIATLSADMNRSLLMLKF